MTTVLKLLLAPALVVASSLAGRWWGQRVSGTLVALPIVAGPILLITCLQQGVHFGAYAARAALLGLVTLAWFALVFAWLSRRFGWLPTLLMAWGSSLVVDFALARVPIGPGWSLPAVVAAAWIVTRLLPGVPPEEAGPVVWPWWDLPARAVATGSLVALVTTVAAVAGPRLTGVLAPFPIATSVVAVFAQARLGSPGAVRVAHGVPRGLLGFSVFCFLVGMLLKPLGIAATFTIAVAATLTAQLAWQAAVARLRTRPQPAHDASHQAVVGRRHTGG